MKSEHKRHFIIISDNSDKKIAIDFIDYKTDDLKAIMKRIKSECGEITLSIHFLHTECPDWESVVQNQDDYFEDICLINTVDDFIECLKRNNENDKQYVRLTIEEYQALVEKNKKLKEYLELAIADMTNFAEESCDDCKNNACRFCAGCMQVNNYDCYFRWGRLAEVKDMINLKNAEIIETQPVRHGEWKEEVSHKEWAGLLPNAWEEEVTIHNGNTSDYDCVCSECGGSGLPYHNYCHTCGVKMDKE